MYLFESSYISYPATLVDSLNDGKIIEKQSSDAINNPTETPPVLYTRDMFYLMNNISSMVPVKWYLGVFSSPRVAIRY